MKPSLLAKLDHLEIRLAELNELLSQPEVTRGLDNFRQLSREHAELEPVVALFQTWKKNQLEMENAQTMLADANARDMHDMAEEEMLATRTRAQELAAELQTLLLPKDENDDKNIFLEIRAGTGGDESALFAGDLLRMYTRFAERNRLQIEIISSSPSDLGGYKEIILRLMGKGAYALFKFESGGHRVQRVPATETQGRIHTSACTVAVLAEVDAVSDVHIRSEDIRVDTFRASGAGGQHINKTDSAVRITHFPTGLVVECQDDRSQHRNRERAMQVLAARIKDKQTSEAQAKEAATRKSLIGSGDRSERIRTYNFPQGRITDHRINLTLYKMDAMMAGELDELYRSLASEHQAELLAALGD